MTLYTAVSLTLPEKRRLLQLWNAEYPSVLCYADSSGLDAYLHDLSHPVHYLLQDEDRLHAWACVFTRAQARWFALIIDRNMQRRGLGKLMMQRLMHDEPVLNGWVVDRENYIRKDGTPYPSPLPFYRKLGFSVCGEQRLELPFMSAACIRSGQ